jgi:WS/DGAT/MGAT family acyltransferase
MSAQTGYFNLMQTLMNPATMTAWQEVAPLMTELMRPPDRLPFNKVCSGERRITWNEFSFAEARAIRAALGGTVNDVALTVLSGAVAKYVRMAGMPTAGRFCRFMCPVNVRREDQRGRLGNQVSALLVNVPLDIEDAGARLKAITKRTEALKNSRLADILSTMTAWAGAIPAPVQAMVGALPFVQFGAPVFNMVCTNVPGPQIPLYAVGNQMMTYYPHVPVGNDLGMGCAIQSYNQKLYFGITSDAAAAPDAVHMRTFLDESFRELLRAAGLPESSDRKVPTPPRPVRARKKPHSEPKSAQAKGMAAVEG